MKHLPVSLLFLAMIFLWACNSKDSTKSTGGINLKELHADKSMHPRDKADVMMSAINAIIINTVAIEDNVQAAVFLNTIMDENANEILGISREFGQWSQDATQEELAAYMELLQSKPYFEELDSNLSVIGERMMETPELKEAMHKFMEITNPQE